MKKGEIYEGVVTSYEFPNKGIVNEEDLKITVKNSLPGQKIKYQLLKKRKNAGQGRLIEIEQRSKIEDSDAFCDRYGECGSCIYQTLSYDNQLQLKKDEVKRLIDRVCSDYIDDGIKQSPDIYGYRNKMEFTFGDACKGGELTLGLHKRGSFYDIIDASCCKLVHNDYGKILTTVKDYCIENELSYFHRITHIGYLRHLLVRRASVTGELLVDIVTTTQNNHDFSELVCRLKALELTGKIVGILHTSNNCVADTITDEHTDILFGQDYFYEEILGLRFKISPFSFFQTNSSGAEVLYETARNYISDCIGGKVIYDLYSGTGTIAQLLAPVARKVIGVEIVEEAVMAARENAKLNGLENCEFIAGDVLTTLETINERPEVIVIDPPRDGVHPKALAAILDYGVDEMVYISCKPTSLARDLILIQEKGYKVERVAMVDMFPWTAHVETVVLLSQQHVDHHIEVDLDLDELDATSAETKATYNEIQQYVLKETGLMVSNLYIAQVKKKCGIEVGESFNKSKSDGAKQPKCPVDKEKAIKDAHKHFGMI